MRLLQRSFDQAEKAVSDDVKLLGFAWTDLAAIEIKTAVLDQKSTELATKQGEIKIEAEKLADILNAVTATQQGFTAKLNAPQQQYEAYQRQLGELTGAACATLVAELAERHKGPVVRVAPDLQNALRLNDEIR
ncbi:hypothetical protein, partial [Klebsiella quasipneumoniae]|uniref:hypothetical protein n=1 Tax=Klebsiella quasipneumoniae TaxID=1463165 RepID=UPI00273162D8